MVFMMGEEGVGDITDVIVSSGSVKGEGDFCYKK